jgi:hypothetical protein
MFTFSNIGGKCWKHVFKTCRMGKTDFQELLAKVTPHIQRQDTWMREAISAAERLSITLRYLATRDSYHSLEYNLQSF